MIFHIWIVFLILGIVTLLAGIFRKSDDRVYLFAFSIPFLIISMWGSFNIQILLQAGNAACVYCSFKYVWLALFQLVLILIDAMFIIFNTFNIFK